MNMIRLGGNVIRLQTFIQITVFSSFFIMSLHPVPMISKINNKSDFGFVVFSHSDSSSCSAKNQEIQAQSEFNQALLLESIKSNKKSAPTVVLRPIYFLDPVTQQKIIFLDKNYEIIPDGLQKAYALWMQGTGNKKFKNPQSWLQSFVGMDIEIMPNEVEMFGYLLNLSRVVVKNNLGYPQKKWISFAKGIFSKLALEVEIIQHKRKGIRLKLHVLHGEGGVCVDGNVESLSATPTLQK